MKDRTREFHAAVESIQSRNSGAMHAAQLVNRLSHSESHRLLNESSPKSVFARTAASIGRDIVATTAKLDKLAKLAKKKSLFDDNPNEIQELTGMIGQDITRLNGSLQSLEGQLKGNEQSRQLKEHSTGILNALRGQLATTSMSFKDVLETRTENMKAQKERRDRFSSTLTSTSSINTNNPLYLPNNTAHVQNEVSILMPLENTLQDQQQLILSNPRDTYLESRSEAIEGIEKTIHELASIFGQLTTLIAAADDQVRIIDQNLESANTNVNMGQQQLLKYMNNISSNRWLMAKIFATLIFFFLLFVLFFA